MKKRWLCAFLFSLFLEILAVEVSGYGTILPIKNGLWIGLTFHLIGAIFLCFSLLDFFKSKELNPWILTGFFLGIYVPVPIFGLLLIFGLVWTISSNRKKPSIDDDYIVGFPKPDFTNIGGQKNHLLSVMEIIHGRNVQLRRNAILSLKSITGFSSLSILRKAMRDSDEHVRSYAQDILRKILEDKENKLSEFLEKHSQSKEDERVILGFIAEYLAVTECHLASREININLPTQMLESLKKLAENNVQACLLLLRLNLGRGDWNEVERSFSSLGEKKYSNFHLLFSELELDFYQRNWPAFFLKLQKNTSFRTLNAYRKIFRFWLPQSMTPTTNE
jgi:hypothetical protein